ncbi:MAG TPA: ribosome-associated translation inhibitor RaiA [Polyangiaceae bacterium]
MQISITFRQMETSDAVKTYANDKISRLQRFMRTPMKAEVKISAQHLSKSAEVDIHSGSHHFHAHETSEDMYATLDQVVDKLERQIRAKKEERSKKGADRASDHLIFDDSSPDGAADEG